MPTFILEDEVSIVIKLQHPNSGLGDPNISEKLKNLLITFNLIAFGLY